MSKPSTCTRRLSNPNYVIPIITFHLLLILGQASAQDNLDTPPQTNRTVYRVLRVTPQTEEHLHFLKQLSASDADFNVDFWKAPTGVGGQVDIMTSTWTPLQNALQRMGMSYNVTIHDVQNLLEQKLIKKTLRQKLVGRRMFDDSGAPRYDLHDYGSYEEMRKYISDITRTYPQFAQDITIGYTHERRPIKALKLGNPVSNVQKPAIWLDGGIHAREWAAPHTAMFMMHQLVSQYGRDREITHMIDSLNFYIVPVVNPDGYEYTRGSLQPNVRLWRKNRSPRECRVDRWGRERCCRGVDLNRNFQFFWGQTGSSDNPCSEIYAGQKPFSEPESQAVRDMLMSRDLRGRVGAFITMHTYSQLWIHPYGHRKLDYPADKDDLRDLGERAVKQLKKLYSTNYVVGSGADTLYPAAGGSDDWAKAVAGAKYVYLLELRPDDRQWDGFILDESELIPTGRETWEGVKVVVRQVMDDNNISVRSQSSAHDAGPSQGSGHAVVAEEPQALCTDRRYACKGWTRTNPRICTSIAYFMRVECALSCKFCTPFSSSSSVT